MKGLIRHQPFYKQLGTQDTGRRQTKHKTTQKPKMISNTNPGAGKG